MTHAYLGLAGLDLLELAAGFGLLHGLGVVRSRPAAPGAVGLAFLTGWAAVGVVLALGAPLGLDPGIAATTAVALALAGAGVACRRLVAGLDEPRLPPLRGRAPRALSLAGSAALAAALAGALVVGVQHAADVSWDAWAFWIPKAEAVYYFHGLDTGLGGYLTYAHPEYPPLQPVTVAAAFHFMGGVHPALLPLEQCLVGVAFAGALVRLLRRRVPGWLLAPSLALLVVAPEFWRRLPLVLPDQDVAYLLGAAAVACALWTLDGHRSRLVLAVLFLAAATQTKAEGTLLSLLLAVAFAAASLLRDRRRGLPALALLLGPATIVPWQIWLRAHGQPASSGDYRWSRLLDPGYLGAHSGRLTYAAGQLLHDLFAPGTWSLLPPLVLLACALALRTAPAVAAAGAGWLLVAFAGLLATYWIGTPDVHWYVATSAERVVGTLPLVGGALMPLLLATVLAPTSA